MSQHLRSFLFLSAAAAVALETGVSQIYMFENGPVALNPLISEGRVNTRTAHPHVLAAIREMVHTVFGVEIEIHNPFAYLTKGEVARLLARQKLCDLVTETQSCFTAFKVAQEAEKLGWTGCEATHDGDCLPCVLRRAAVEAAGLRPWDAGYLIDVFEDYPNLPHRALMRVADLLRFCRNVLALDDAALLQRVPELSVCEEGTDCRKLVAMLRRHSNEVRGAFKARANKRFRADFAALL